MLVIGGLTTPAVVVTVVELLKGDLNINKSGDVNMDDLMRFVRFVRVLFYLRELDDEIYCESDDVQYIINSLKGVVDDEYIKESKFELSNSLTSIEYFNLLDKMFYVVCDSMYELSITTLSNYNTQAIKRAYLIFMQLTQLKESYELERVRDESIKVFDLLSIQSNHTQKNYYYELESNGLLCERFDVSLMIEICLKYLNEFFMYLGVEFK